LTGSVRPSQGYYAVSIQQLSLGGGVARTQCHIKPGRTVPLEFHRIRASVLVREARPQELTFELVTIGHEDRSRLRRPLISLQSKGN
jgi:hypothetical protein